MGSSFLLIFLCLVTVHLTIGTAGLTLPLSQADGNPGSLSTISLNASNPTNVELCTTSLIWTGSTDFDARFSGNCYQAFHRFLRTDMKENKGTLFQFAQQGVTPGVPGVLRMATPRRYVKDTCTIAIVNMADVPGGILPDEPPGPFPRSDLAHFADFRSPMHAVRTGCVGRRKEPGWAIAGRQQAMAVLLYSTNAPIDRIIPRGVIP